MTYAELDGPNSVNIFSPHKFMDANTFGAMVHISRKCDELRLSITTAMYYGMQLCIHPGYE